MVLTIDIGNTNITIGAYKDDELVFVSRKDYQIKHMGHRIELGEIESVIRGLEEVKDCAVIARNDASGEKAIYAYIVSDEEVSVSSVRDRLGKVLPEYMIPAYMGQIEAIPVTRNGKLDRRALPEIEASSSREYVAPQNETEEKVVKVFEEILGAERIGVKDNFFEMGGHSLRATRALLNAFACVIIESWLPILSLIELNLLFTSSNERAFSGA